MNAARRVRKVLILVAMNGSMACPAVHGFTLIFSNGCASNRLGEKEVPGDEYYTRLREVAKTEIYDVSTITHVVMER